MAAERHAALLRTAIDSPTFQCTQLSARGAKRYHEQEENMRRRKNQHEGEEEEEEEAEEEVLVERC